MAKRQKAPEGVIDIFSVLGDDQDKGGEPKPEQKAPDTGALEAKIEAMQNELRRLEKTNAALMIQSPVYTPPQQTQTKVPEPDFSGMPDPVTDAEAYHKEMAKRMLDHIKAEQAEANKTREAQAAEQNTRQAQVSNLWGEFEEKYPDLAEHKDMVEFAAVTVANRARAKGVDVNRYMFGASEQYIEDVAAEMRKKFGKAIEVMAKEAEAGDADGADAPAEGSISAAMAQARTRGITGGIPSSGKEPKPAAEGAGEDDGLLADLQKVQRSMGII